MSAEVAKKRCTRCDREKLLSFFQRDNRQPDGRKSTCASCTNERERQRSRIQGTPAAVRFNAFP